MTAETYSLLSWIFWGASGLCLIAGIVLFILFRIPTVIGDLSGRTAQKSINKMWDKSDKKTGSNGTLRNATKSKKADKGIQVRKTKEAETLETGLLNGAKVNNSADETELLINAESANAVIDSAETEWLMNTPYKESRRVGGKKLEVIEEIVLIHTNEVI